MRGFGSLLIPAWSPGYLVGALYVLSLAAFVASRATCGQRHEPTIAATAGATAFGAVAFTYFLGRSAPSNLHHVALPAVVASCGWWTIGCAVSPRRRQRLPWAAVLAAACVVRVAGRVELERDRRLDRAAHRLPRSCGLPRPRPASEGLLVDDEDGPDRRGRIAAPCPCDAGRQPASSSASTGSRRCSSQRTGQRTADRQRQPGRADRPTRRSRESRPRPTDFPKDHRRSRRPVHAPAAHGRSLTSTPSATSPVRRLSSSVASYAALAERFELRVARARSLRLRRSRTGEGADERASAQLTQRTPSRRADPRDVHAFAQGDSPHRPRAVQAGGRRPHRLGAVRSPTSSPRSTADVLRDRRSRTTPTATGSSSRRATRASRSTRRSTCAGG